MNKYTHYLKGKKQIIFFLWIAGYFTLSIASLFTALIPPKLPNSSLLIFGFGVICGWQILLYLDFYCAEILNRPKKTQISMGATLSIINIIVFISGIISAYKTFRLFPHPNILERFFGKSITLQLPTLVYIPALVIIYLIGHKCFFLILGKYTNKMKDIQEGEKRKEELLKSWFEKIENEQVPEEKEKETFCPVFWRMIGLRILYMLLWMSIPTWIFWGIPFKSLPLFSIELSESQKLVGEVYESLSNSVKKKLDRNQLSVPLRKIFKNYKKTLSKEALVSIILPGKKWKIIDVDQEKKKVTYYLEVRQYMKDGYEPQYQLNVTRAFSFRYVSKAYLIGMLFVACIILFWLMKIITSAYQYQVSNVGIYERNILGNKKFKWHQLKGIFVYDGILVFEEIRGKRWHIPLKDFKESRIVWNTLIKYLPCEILLISEEGWRYLNKTLANGFQDFVSQYQKVWMAKQEKNKKAKKAKRHK